MNRIAFLFLVFMNVASSSYATIFDIDQRVPLETLSMGYLPVGTVNTSSITGGYATGFLVSQCHVLTVRHLVRSKNVIGTQIDFRTNFYGKSIRSRGVIIAAGDFRESEAARTVGQNRRGDWAVAKLSKCIGKSVGYLSLSSQSNLGGQRLALAGFPSDRSRTVVTVDPVCRIRAGLGRQVLHDCATKRGNSGSPLINVADRTVVAMHTAGVPSRGVQEFSLSQAGIAVPSREIIQLIDAAIRT